MNTNQTTNQNELSPAELLASSEKLQKLAKEIANLKDKSHDWDICKDLTQPERDAIGCCCG